MAVGSQFVDKLSQPQSPEEQAFFTDEDGEELPGVTGQGIGSMVANMKAAQEEDLPPDAAARRRPPLGVDTARRTALHKIINEMWGQPEIADYMSVRLSQYMDLDSAKKTGNGFKITTHNGIDLKWGLLQTPEGQHYEAITAPKRHFTQDTADALISLSMLHGWREIDVHGKQEHKEMMWLAVQRHAMIEQEEFEKQQALGAIPADAKYMPPVVSNFRPAEDSAVYRQWLKERAEWEAQRAVRGGETIDAGTPAATQAETPPAPEPDAAAKPETAKPEIAQPEAAEPAKEKPAAPQKAAPAKADGGMDDGINAKNPAFEARHPRDKDGHFVNKETGKHAPIKKRAGGEMSGTFNEKAPRTKTPAAALKNTQDRKPRNNGKTAPPPP